MEDNKHTSDAQEVEEVDEAQVADENVVEVEDEEQTTTTSQAEEGDRSSEASDEDNESQDDEESETDKEFTNALKKVRNEAKNLRKRLKEAQAEIEKLQASSNDELVKERDDYKRQLEELRSQIRDEKARAQVIASAKKAGAIEPEAVADIIASKGLITFENDTPTNIDVVVTELRDTYKRLFTGVVGNGNAGSRDERGSEVEGMNSRSLLVKAYKKHED